MVSGDLVTIVVPSYQGESALPQLLGALAGQTRRPDELIIVESRINAAIRRVVRQFESSGDAFPLRLLPNLRGSIPAALNLGVAAARGATIIRLDVRALPAPDYVERCLAALDASGAEVAGGRWLIAPQAATRTARAVAWGLGCRLGNGGAAYRRQPPPPPGDVDTVPYGCWRKSTWERLGGFNEALLTNEDYEFNWRVRRAGGRVFFDPAIVSTYVARPTLSSLARQYFRYGWWKAQMLRSHPRSLCWRQALPGLLPLGLTVPPVFALYLLALVWAAVRAVNVLVIPALLTEHIAWAAGFWTNLITRARWPAWRAAAGATTLLPRLVGAASD